MGLDLFQRRPVDGIGHGDEPGGQRDFLAGQAVGKAGPVPSLVVVADGRRHVPAGGPERLRSEDSDLLVRMEKLFSVKLAFRADPNYHVENFKIINANTNEEYR